MCGFTMHVRFMTRAMRILCTNYSRKKQSTSAVCPHFNTPFKIILNFLYPTPRGSLPACVGACILPNHSVALLFLFIECPNTSASISYCNPFFLNVKRVLSFSIYYPGKILWSASSSVRLGFFPAS
jgi:hypothetical protein